MADRPMGGTSRTWYEVERYGLRKSFETEKEAREFIRRHLWKDAPPRLMRVTSTVRYEELET